MSRLIWDAVGEKFYEMGTKLGVLYPMNNTDRKSTRLNSSH